MGYPEPEIGLVISYSYLWSEEAVAGHAEGRKNRPCAILLVIQQAEGEPEESQWRLSPVAHRTIPESRLRFRRASCACRASQLFITFRRRSRPPELHGDGEIERQSRSEGLARHGGAAPRPTRSTWG